MHFYLTGDKQRLKAAAENADVVFKKVVKSCREYLNKREEIAAPKLTVLLQGMHDDSIRKRTGADIRCENPLPIAFGDRTS